MAAVDVRLTAEDLTALNDVSALVREYPGWMLERMAGERLASVR
jgi:hypothetical protein